MNEEFKECLNEFLNNKTYIMVYRFNYNSAREFNKDLILYIKQLQKENRQLKEKLEASEKVRLKCLNKIKTLGKFDGENFTRSFTLWSADFNELAKILDIDKGE